MMRNESLLRVLLSRLKHSGLILLSLLFAQAVCAQSKPRARDLGVPFDGTPGPLNAITDVRGVEVGQTTLISGDGKLIVGRGPVRTGVTVILPRGKDSHERVFGAWFSLNGNGEMTGTTWLEESGCLEGPIALTNTHSVGVVRDAVVEWLVRRIPNYETTVYFSLPVVAETWDGYLNDINGFHVKKEHVFQALESAAAGPVAEGNVGGGTGMQLYDFKGGTGTASRRLSEKDGGYTVGVLVQGNYGRREELRVAGVPVGRELTDLMPVVDLTPHKDGSIIVVVATDAPLLPHQLKRVARRVSLALGRNGSVAHDYSGDIFIAFSTANPEAAKAEGVAHLNMLPNESIDPIFAATIQATEEAVINAMVAAETMRGINGNTIYAIPHDRLREILKKYNRLVK